jgi:hypothetical protein
MEYQMHFGKKFYLDKQKGYWISTTCPRIRAHVWVWKYHHGEIEKGFHIHHKDEDKSNNNIENLEKISCSKHLSLHMNKEENIKRATEQANKVRHLTKIWHASDEGREWHIKHGLKTWIDRKSFKIKCLMCKKEIETKTYHQKFCHQNCKAKYARRLLKSKID